MSKLDNVGLIPLWNFGEIVPNLYRSAQPLWGFQYKWLKEWLGVSIIVNLRSESRHDSMNSKLYGLNVMNIDVTDHQPPTIEQAVDFMKFIENSSFTNGKDSSNDARHINQVASVTPILIHCEHGHGRTSTFSVLAKMALGMSLENAIQDERDRFHYEFRHHTQVEWLKAHESILTNFDNLG